MYAVTHETAGGTTLPLINLTGSASAQVKLFDVMVGTTASPSNEHWEVSLGRTTSVGSGGTTLTENKFNPSAPDPNGAAMGGPFGGAPTFTANSELLRIGLNQQATFRWVAVPGREFVSALASANGLELRCDAFSSGTPNIMSTLHWFE